jgi:hypothetical protein
MTIYHGSSVIVETPELCYSVRALDFGKGFYTTTNEEQAVQFARKVHERKIREGAENPGCFVSSYDIDYDAMRKLFNQMTFATEKSLSFLHFTGYREIASWEN